MNVSGPSIGPVPVEFILFGCVLAGVALFHAYTLRIALGGALLLALYKIVFSSFTFGTGVAGFGSHLLHEWVIPEDLLLMLGFAQLAIIGFNQGRTPRGSAAPVAVVHPSK